MKKLSIAFLACLLCVFTSACSEGNSAFLSSSEETSDITTSQQSDEPANNTAGERNFIAGKYLVVVDGTLICATGDGIYLKDDVNSEGKKIADEKNVYTIMSDGETIYFAEGYDTSESSQRNTPKKVYRESISGGDTKELFSSGGYIELIGYYDDCLYFLDQNASNQCAIMKYNVTNDEQSKLTTDWDGQIVSPCMLGDYLYACLKSNDSNTGIMRKYDLSTGKTEDIYSGIVDLNIYHDSNFVVFDSYVISTNSNGYTKNDHFTYIIDKEGNVKQSPEIEIDCDFEYVTSDAKYGLYFSGMNSGKFDLYTIDLDTGEVFTSENGAASCKGKNYFITNDLLRPENIYFMYSLNRYDPNSKSVQTVSHDEFKIDIMKPMWIIDGYIMDWNLNTYQIYETEETTTPLNSEPENDNSDSFDYTEGTFSSSESPVILTIEEIANGKVVMHGQQGSQNKAYFPHAEGYLYDKNKMDFVTVDSWGSKYAGHLELHPDSVDLYMELTKKSKFAEDTIECDCRLMKE